MQTTDPTRSGLIAAYCAYSNANRPGSTFQLSGTGWVTMTYASTLRFGSDHGDESFETSHDAVLHDLLVANNNCGQIKLVMFHGRASADEEMEDMGYNHDATEGYEGRPVADLVHIREGGLHLLTLRGGDLDSLFIPFVDGMLFYDGHYYGDFSLTALG